MTSTYRAVEISSPGVFSLVERKVAVPGAGQVRIRVEACGVCHSDAATVEAQFPNLSYPRVPGHEVIGRIEEVGTGVTAWKVGQRLGVGDRKSTRLNSSHDQISYAVFCLKKKNKSCFRRYSITYKKLWRPAGLSLGMPLSPS